MLMLFYSTKKRWIFINKEREKEAGTELASNKEKGEFEFAQILLSPFFTI